jgi:hypothetical protein
MAESPTPLIPDPDAVRSRLADISREQMVLRKMLRAIEAGRRAGMPLSLNQPRGQEEGDSGD